MATGGIAGFAKARQHREKSSNLYGGRNAAREDRAMGIGHTQGNRVLARIFVLGAAALVAATLPPRSAVADQEKVLHSFCARGGARCTDGSTPVAGLIMDASGNLYGTTAG